MFRIYVYLKTDSDDAADSDRFTGDVRYDFRVDGLEHIGFRCPLFHLVHEPSGEVAERLHARVTPVHGRVIDLSFVTFRCLGRFPISARGIDGFIDRTGLVDLVVDCFCVTLSGFPVIDWLGCGFLYRCRVASRWGFRIQDGSVLCHFHALRHTLSEATKKPPPGKGTARAEHS